MKGAATNSPFFRFSLHILKKYALITLDVLQASTVPYYRDALGLGEPHIEEVPTQKVRVAMFDVAGVHIELLEPTSPESAIAKAIEKKGEGIHHIAFKTNDIAGNISLTTRRSPSCIPNAPSAS